MALELDVPVVLREPITFVPDPISSLRAFRPLLPFLIPLPAKSRTTPHAFGPNPPRIRRYYSTVRTHERTPCTQRSKHAVRPHRRHSSFVASTPHFPPASHPNLMHRDA